MGFGNTMCQHGNRFQPDKANLIALKMLREEVISPCMTPRRVFRRLSQAAIGQCGSKCIVEQLEGVVDYLRITPALNDATLDNILLVEVILDSIFRSATRFARRTMRNNGGMRSYFDFATEPNSDFWFGILPRSRLLNPIMNSAGRKRLNRCLGCD